VLHSLQELRQVIDDRLRDDLGGRYDRHNAQSVGTDKLTVTFTLRAASHADAIRSAGLAAGTLAELLTHHAAAVDLSGVALVVRAQQRNHVGRASRSLPRMGQSRRSTHRRARFSRPRDPRNV